jgi:hypothetical protein
VGATGIEEEEQQQKEVMWGRISNLQRQYPSELGAMATWGRENI